ncbi:hypothetical protein BH10BAC5_BH10BAC5_26920 [soil metagenome]
MNRLRLLGQVNLLCILAFVILTSHAFAQISAPGTPVSFTNTSLKDGIDTKVMPGYDQKAIDAEDLIESKMKDIPYRFGYLYEVNFGITNSGTWETLADGSKVWRLAIVCPGSFGVNLIYDHFYMPKGAKFYIYNSDRTMMIGAFTDIDNLPEGSFSTQPVKGERIILEYNQPAYIRETALLNISSVTHEYKDIFRILNDKTFGQSGACNINVHCPVADPYQKQVRSSAMIISGGSRICSGSLINNTRFDGTPFFISANHCGTAVTNWIFMFKYESPGCTNIDGPTTNTVSGATLLASNSASDFTLSRLSSRPPASYNVYYAGWNRQDVAATSGFGVHHPSGDIKKISFADGPNISDTWSGTPANSHWHVFWTLHPGAATLGITEPGSSGSPQYDQNGRYIGQLHGGPSSCSATDKSDFYGKFSMSWDYGTTPSTRAKDWLDSNNTGALFIDGYDPLGTALSAFNIQTPSAGTRIVTSAGSTTPVTITWDTASQGIQYKFSFGNPLPTRRFSINSTTNSITTTLGALDVILANSGFTNTGLATDSAVGNWDVWAYKNAGAPGPDSLKSTNGPRTITFRRQTVTISAFSLIAPAANFTITTNPIDPTPVIFSWTRSGNGGALYRWLFKTGLSYSDPATFRVTSNNAGFDTTLSLRGSQLDTLLAVAGVAPGDSLVGYWRARSFTSSDSVNSTAPDRKITLKRASLLPLFQNFADANMPPAFWGLSIGSAATQYWTRASFSSYGSSTPGCAFYNFWSASATTGPQTLTSNQFPPVSAPGNFLRFDEACAWYSATSIDSCIIETSTNAGTSWTRLIGMYQNLNLSSGTNSTPVMTTVSATAQFLAPTAGQWATKIYSMPVGTNMVRFIAKSAFGNNLYIDNITSGTSTGIGDPISFTPTKYELFQNFPNPFNPSTKINFSLPKQGLVTLKIYDMLGKEVSTLVNEIRTAGNYSVDFNASNLASGVYFYRIESADFRDTKRMMLIK